MPGPKYGEFQFPKSFGFTGSATDSLTTSVRGHERAKPRFAEGGAVKKDPPPKTPPPKTPPTTPKVEGKGSLIDIMRGKTRREQEAELGLKKGGKVMKKAKGGPVVTKGKEPGHATQQREPEQSNNMDQESGGRSPLRPGFKKGGKPMRKAMGGPVTAARGGMKNTKGC